MSKLEQNSQTERLDTSLEHFLRAEVPRNVSDLISKMKDFPVKLVAANGRVFGLTYEESAKIGVLCLKVETGKSDFEVFSGKAQDREIKFLLEAYKNECRIRLFEEKGKGSFDAYSFKFTGRDRLGCLSLKLCYPVQSMEEPDVEFLLSSDGDSLH